MAQVSEAATDNVLENIEKKRVSINILVLSMQPENVVPDEVGMFSRRVLQCREKRTESLRHDADSDQHRRRTIGATSTDHLPQFGRSLPNLATRIGRRLPGSGLHVPVRASEGEQRQRMHLDVNEPVGPVNNWLQSLLSQVDVYLHDTLVTPSTNTYMYRAYIETALSNGYEAKNTQLTSQLWYKDTAGHLDTIDDTNEMLWDRKAYVADGRVVELMGRLPVD